MKTRTLKSNRRPWRSSKQPRLATSGEQHDDDATVDCLSIAEFCRRNSVSVQFFYKSPELMPETFRLGTRRLITREAADRWRMARNT